MSKNRTANGYLTYRLRRVATGLLAMLALSGSTGHAAIPDANGVIHGCYATKNGALTLLDTAVSPSCKSNEVAIQWNVQGPAVSAGDIGFQVAFPDDVDGNGVADASTDGLLLLRYLLGIRGSALINGAIGVGAARNTAAQVEAYIQAAIIPQLQ